MKIKYVATLVTGQYLLTMAAMTFVQAEETNSVSDTLKDGLRRGSDGSAIGQPVDTPDPFFLFLEILVYLALIIGMIYLLARWMNKKRWGGQTGKRIHVLAGTSFGPSKSVQVVKVGESVYLLGVGDNVQLIDKWDDPDMVQVMMDQFRPVEEPDPVQFIGSFIDRWKKGRKQSSEHKRGERIVRSFDQTEENRSSFQQIVMDRMQQMPNRRKAIEKWLEDEPKPEDRNDRS